jgi:adenylate cyclase
MSSLVKTVCAGAVISLIGTLFCLSPWGADLEETIGLDLIFHLRGFRKPPPDVVLVAIDQASADHFELPLDPRRWPRSLHARLIQRLKESKASVIVFDLLFAEESNSEEDRLLAESMREAGNVILAEGLISEIIPIQNAGGSVSVSFNSERVVQPLEIFRNASLATACFPLPKLFGRVNSFWTFKPEMFKSEIGNAPTLPLVAYQAYALRRFPQIRQFMTPLETGLRSDIRTESGEQESFKRAAQILRECLRSESALHIDPEIQRCATVEHPFEADRFLNAFVSAYSGPDQRYLNFYGPAGSFPTCPYYLLAEADAKEPIRASAVDVQGKAVFIGLMDPQRPSLRDSFYTVFSRPDGVDMSGVEIAATSFANLLEGTCLWQLPGYLDLTVVFIWGFILAWLGWQFSTPVAWGITIAADVTYGVVVYKIFAGQGLWLPLAVPVFLQTPIALVGVLTWRYVEVHRESNNIRTAFGYYLPDAEVDRLARKVRDIGDSRQVVYATCLVTDAENYTGLSEQMNPEELSCFVNEYFEAMFEPVRRNSGVISDVKGDSMLALWPAPDPDTDLRACACRAAIEIQSAVSRFNRAQAIFRLPTRICIHSGFIALGNVGALHHYEYRPIGDIVNTASKLEHLNKRLGTKTLVSASVIGPSDSFLCRDLGGFRLPGKSKTIEVCELVTLVEASNETQRQICRMFVEALQAFRQGFWAEAAVLFHQVLGVDPNDGPSRFYGKLCESFRAQPPEPAWDGAIEAENMLTHS